MITIEVCVGSSCYLKGAHQIVQYLQEALQEADITDAVELRCVFCLGQCQNGPNLLVDGKLLSGITPEKVKELIHQVILPQVRGE